MDMGTAVPQRLVLKYGAVPRVAVAGASSCGLRQVKTAGGIIVRPAPHVWLLQEGIIVRYLRVKGITMQPALRLAAAGAILCGHRYPRMFTHEEIYSPSVGRSSPLFTDTWDRLRQYTVLPMMAALALIAGAMTLIDQWTNTVRFVQFLVTGKYSTELEGDPPFSTAKREGMLGGLQSYAMAENPQYAAWMRDGPESIPGQALQRVEVPRWRATTILAMKCRAGRAPISTEHYSAASGVQYSPSRRTAQPPDEDAWKVSPAKYAIL
ncbi:hypothetical protein CYMTET_29031 [Cymbomonas tetramitiformis]|uniref:Uncharacterized protein n=1 Tax=Cymbomonas tetramitiformis TaxID=36881 RepID=A0AAE0KVB5_9CHLO|nr:hypothetical protein CYMTET_29031 [Cymbomonas tetramitiformis]